MVYSYKDVLKDIALDLVDTLVLKAYYILYTILGSQINICASYLHIN